MAPLYAPITSTRAPLFSPVAEDSTAIFSGLEQISLDDGCGFLPSPCLYDFPPSTTEELTTVLIRTSDYTDDDEACPAPIPQHLKWCYFTIVKDAFQAFDALAHEDP
jgi:hypothetical protein